MLVSTFEILVKPQLPSVLPPGTPPIPGIGNLSRKVIQGYFLTVANVNFFPVTVSLVFTLKFPVTVPPRLPSNFQDFLDIVDITGENIFGPAPQARLIPEIVPQNNKARLTFTIPENTTGLIILQPNILRPGVLEGANFEARGYVEIFLSSLSGSDEATLLVTPEHRGTFFKNLTGATLAEVGLDQIAYALPVSNGGVFLLSNT
ncbi:MAG: hypothetical protein RLZZ135_1396 [Cyanobacteriota bacterium]|jgi:hypothetical protein